MNKKIFIGEWNFSVVVTYFGLFSAVYGLCMILEGLLNYALVCLIISGLCDLVDGAVARKCKRSDTEKLFGVQIDSLVDVVSFLCLPVVIILKIKISYLILFVCAFYFICGVARLAHFNISSEIDVIKGFYQGLPVTSISFLLPICYVVINIFNFYEYACVFLMFIMGFLFVLNIPVKKPSKQAIPLFFVIAFYFIYVLLWVVK